MTNQQETSKLDVPLTVADLLPGDVMLYRRTSLLGRAIRLLDGGPFSHAALYVGAGEVVEAIGSGVRSVTVTESLGHEKGDAMCAFRREMKSGHAEPVIGLARQFVSEGTKYAFHDVFLCAGLALTRRLPLTPFFRTLIRNVLDSAAGRLIEMATTGRARPLMCSELVFMCYLRAPAEPLGALRLAIGGWPMPDGSSESLVAPLLPEKGSLLDVVKRRGLAEAPLTGAGPARDDAYSETDGPPDDLELLVNACEKEKGVWSPDDASEADEGTAAAQLAASFGRLAFALRSVEVAARGPLASDKALDESSKDPPGLAEIERWLSHFVSPRDLERSPTLKSLGPLAIG